MQQFVRSNPDAAGGYFDVNDVNDRGGCDDGCHTLHYDNDGFG